MPTIDELEAILNQPDGFAEILPDGTIRTQPWPDPTSEMLETPQFDAVWQAIKRWDIAVPDAYQGYCGATGNHVRAILDALAKVAVSSATG